MGTLEQMFNDLRGLNACGGGLASTGTPEGSDSPIGMHATRVELGCQLIAAPCRVAPLHLFAFTPSAAAGMWETAGLPKAGTQIQGGAGLTAQHAKNRVPARAE
jgi:hypothetical protein